MLLTGPREKGRGENSLAIVVFSPTRCTGSLSPEDAEVFQKGPMLVFARECVKRSAMITAEPEPYSKKQLRPLLRP